MARIDGHTFDMLPEAELTEEQQDFRTKVKEFADNEIRPLDLNELEWRDDPHDRVPWDVVEKGANEYNLMEVTVPEEYGGMDASALEIALGTEELAAGDMGIGHIFTYTWKRVKEVDMLANDELRDEYFENLIDDPLHLITTARTEPAVGTDKTISYPGFQFNTTAEKDGDHWVLNGKKHFLTNGADAKVYLVYAQTDPTASGMDGTTLFLVPRHFEGVEVTHIHEKISQRLVNNATVEFTDVRVPERRVMGEVNNAMKEGPQVSPIEAGSTALGTARRAFEEAFSYANERVQGGTEIINHQSIGHDFAQMYTDLYAARSLIWTAARALDRGTYSTEQGAMANMFASRVAFDVSTKALEKFGGKGIMLSTPAQRYVRDTLSYLHSSGTEEALKQKIIDNLLNRVEPAI